jgi:hypothetical protein
MIEVELTKQQVDLLMPALKAAETFYTEQGDFKVCKNLTKIYDSLYRQIFTYGQVEEVSNA